MEEASRWVGLNATQICFLLLFLIPLYFSNHQHSRLLIITTILQYNNIYNEKNSKEKFIQNASNGSNFFNTCFFRFRIDTLYSQQGFKYILKILIPKCFISDDLLRKNYFYGFYPCHTGIIKWSCPINE